MQRKTVTQLRTMEVANRPTKMDVGSLQEMIFDGYSETEWVHWQDAGRPEEEPEGGENPSLDAIQRKGKGKGKGSWSVKGKGKGKDGEAKTSAAAAPAASAKGAQGETR